MFELHVFSLLLCCEHDDPVDAENPPLADDTMCLADTRCSSNLSSPAKSGVCRGMIGSCCCARRWSWCSLLSPRRLRCWGCLLLGCVSLLIIDDWIWSPIVIKIVAMRNVETKLSTDNLEKIIVQTIAMTRGYKSCWRMCGVLMVQWERLCFYIMRDDGWIVDHNRWFV